MTQSISDLYDRAWDAFAGAKAFLTPQQAVWAVDTMEKHIEQGYRLVISKMNSIREKAMEDLKQKLETYRELKKTCDALEAEIKAACTEAGETISAKGIQAVYKQGRKTFDWQGAAAKAGSEMDPEAFQSVLDDNTTPKVDWKKVATAAGVVNAPFTQSAPTVAIKIVDDEIAPFPEFPQA